MNQYAIVLAGGEGKRFGSKKQFLSFRGNKLWEIVKDKAAAVVGSDNVVVVGVDIKGGETRTLSVKNGLNALPRNDGRVIICEAARPLVTSEQISALLSCDSPSVTFVMPLVNTVVKRDGTYLNRNEMYELLTPQAFDLPLLRQAYDSNLFRDVTDETRIMYEHHGIVPNFIEADQALIKVTYPRDVFTLESLYEIQNTDLDIRRE